MGKATRFTTRKELRDKVCELLHDQTLAGPRVYANRVRAVQTDELPVILVYPRSEDITSIDRANNIRRRDLTLAVEILASDTSEQGMSDQLDEIADKVEDILHASDGVNQLAHDIGLDQSEAGLSGDGQMPEGAWRLDFLISYIRKEEA